MDKIQALKGLRDGFLAARFDPAKVDEVIGGLMHELPDVLDDPRAVLELAYRRVSA